MQNPGSIIFGAVVKKKDLRHMFKSEQKTIWVDIVGWVVNVSNVFLFISFYYVLITNQPPAPQAFINLLSVLAVFPLDFFHRYLNDSWFVHFCWIFIVVLCAVGILLRNLFARCIFIIINLYTIIT